MKTIKSLLLVVAITFSSVLFANTNPNSETKKAISMELTELLKNPQIELKDDLVANVKIMLNDNNEIVVLSVENTNVEVKNYIKSRLNYKKLKHTDSKNRLYIVPLRINAPKA